MNPLLVAVLGNPQLLLPLGGKVELCRGTYVARVVKYSDEVGCRPELVGREGTLVAILRDHGCGGVDPMYALLFGDTIGEFWPEELEWLGPAPRVVTSLQGDE